MWREKKLCATIKEKMRYIPYIHNNVTAYIYVHNSISSSTTNISTHTHTINTVVYRVDSTVVFFRLFEIYVPYLYMENRCEYKWALLRSTHHILQMNSTMYIMEWNGRKKKKKITLFFFVVVYIGSQAISLSIKSTSLLLYIN